MRYNIGIAPVGGFGPLLSTKILTMSVRTAIAVVVLLLTWNQASLALDGARPLNLTLMNGWKGLELLTQADDISAFADAGYGATASRGRYDGLGFFLNGNQAQLLVNHETADAAISRVDLDVTALRQSIDNVRAGAPLTGTFVRGMGYAYNQVYDTTYHAVSNPNPVASGVAGVAAYGAARLDRFCSGSHYLPEQFGPGRGFADPIYITGDEVSGGKFYGVDPVQRNFWELNSLGLGFWENATIVDTGNTTNVAMILASDNGTAPGDYLQMYVGTKGLDANSDGAVDFLERNGLRGGTIYYFDPDGAASTTDLPDGAVAGLWSTSTTGALRDTKIEDITVNPRNGFQVAFNGQLDGVYAIDLTFNFASGAFVLSTSSVTIRQVRDNDIQPIDSPDNIDWSRDGNLYVNEDGSGNGVFMVSLDGLTITQLATGASETTGIVDISDELGYTPGSVLLQALQGACASGAQIVALISPTANYLPAGDYDASGLIDAPDYHLWAASFVAPRTLVADGNHNALLDAGDYTIWRDALPAPSQGQNVPEPASILLTLFAIGWRSIRRLQSGVETSLVSTEISAC